MGKSVTTLGPEFRRNVINEWTDTRREPFKKVHYGCVYLYLYEGVNEVNMWYLYHLSTSWIKPR